jgi:hypothetical protein
MAFTSPCGAQVHELRGTKPADKISLCRKWLGPLDGIVIAKLIAANAVLVELDVSH